MATRHELPPQFQPPDEPPEMEPLPLEAPPPPEPPPTPANHEKERPVDPFLRRS